MADVAKAKHLVKEPCEERPQNNEGLRRKLKHLQQLILTQDKALKRGINALNRARGKAGDIAKRSATMKSRLEQGLAMQKRRTKRLAEAKQRASNVDETLLKLRKEADAAMQNAVKVAGETGDSAEVSAAKDRAHSLYRNMVDEKIRVASIHREVIEAQKQLAESSKEVERQISDAKKTATGEASALKEVSAARRDLSRAKLLKYKYEADQLAAKYTDTRTKEQGAAQRLHNVTSEVVEGSEAVEDAKIGERIASRASQAVGGIRVDQSKLDVGALEDDARKAAAQDNAHSRTPQ